MPICVKNREKLLNEMFSFFIKNKLISLNHSGFKPGGSCINQFLSINHEIYYEFFDFGLEVGSVFLDISITSDKVWHNGIISKLKKWNIGELTKVFTGFFRENKTARSPQRQSLYTEKHPCWSISGLQLWFSVIFEYVKVACRVRVAYLKE